MLIFRRGQTIRNNISLILKQQENFFSKAEESTRYTHLKSDCLEIGFADTTFWDK